MGLILNAALKVRHVCLAAYVCDGTVALISKRERTVWTARLFPVMIGPGHSGEYALLVFTLRDIRHVGQH